MTCYRRSGISDQEFSRTTGTPCAQLIDDLRDPQPAPELRHHRQRPQPFLQHAGNRDLRPRPPAPPASP